MVIGGRRYWIYAGLACWRWLPGIGRVDRRVWRLRWLGLYLQAGRDD